MHPRCEKSHPKEAGANAVHTDAKRVKRKEERSDPKAEALRMIIDSGASGHIVSNHGMLNCVQNIESMSLNLAKGTMVIADYRGP